MAKTRTPPLGMWNRLGPYSRILNPTTLESTSVALPGSQAFYYPGQALGPQPHCFLPSEQGSGPHCTQADPPQQYRRGPCTQKSCADCQGH